MDTRFKPKAGRFGVAVAFLPGKQLDAGITASATVVVPIASAFRKQFLVRCSVAAQTLPIGGGAITAQLFKKPVGAAAFAVTAAVDLTVATQTAQQVGNMAITSTLTDAQRILNEGDSLYVNVVAASTVTTQPVGTIFTAETFVLE